MMHRVNLTKCVTDEDFDLAKKVTHDYMEWLGFDLCFQNITAELENFSDMYGAPKGCFLLLKQNESILGGVGCRQLEAGVCEMKRLFLHNKYKGKGLGKKLCLSIMSEAQKLGYKKMRLDTVKKLKAANALYEQLGFYNIAPYNFNPDVTVRYMEIEL